MRDKPVGRDAGPHPGAEASPGGLRRRHSAKAPEFGTFWHGPLDAMTYTCLASFAHVGADLCVYAYDHEIDLPAGVDWTDARQICPDETLLSRYLTDGKPSLAKFADMFRYKLIRETGCCWVDADIVCLRKPDALRDEILFGRQSNPYGEILINNAVLRLPSTHPLLSELIQDAEDVVDVDQKWGAIGPFLLTELAVRQGIAHCARDFFSFYPIEPDDFWKMLSPAHRDSVAVATEHSIFLHLWGEMFGRSAYDKMASPPVGSFLHEMFQRIGTLHRFERVYGERELGDLMAEWVSRDDFSGQTMPPV
jgi:hypothetical protein